MAVSKKPSAKRGRPRKPINAKQVENLAGIGCTNKEIAVVLGCSDDTLTRNFADAIEKGRQGMKMSLRRIQMDLAKRGNATMAIWLGKQYLGQADKQEHTGKDGAALFPQNLDDAIRQLREKQPGLPEEEARRLIEQSREWQKMATERTQ